MEKKDLPHLITILPSHYCEKVRWGFDHIKMKFREEHHPPVFHWGVTLVKYKNRTVPLLITETGEIFKDSTDILKYLDSKAPAHLKLYPENEVLRKEVEDLENYFDEKLGPHTRRWAYFYLFQKPELIFKTFGDGSNLFEESMFQFFFPPIRFLMKKGMNITPESVERSRNRIVEVFEKVGEILSDGRRYLVGNRLTAADITFASLGGPAVVPPEYLPIALGRLPEMMASEVDEFRKMKAGMFILDLFSNERREKIIPVIADAPDDGII